MNKMMSYAVASAFMIAANFGFADCHLIIGPNTVDISGLNKSRLIRALYKYATPVGSKAYCRGAAGMNNYQAKTLYQASEDKFFTYINGRYMNVDLSQQLLDTSEYNKVNGHNAAENAICEEFHSFVHDPKQLTPIDFTATLLTH